MALPMAGAQETASQHRARARRSVNDRVFLFSGLCCHDTHAASRTFPQLHLLTPVFAREAAGKRQLVRLGHFLIPHDGFAMAAAPQRAGSLVVPSPRALGCCVTYPGNSSFCSSQRRELLLYVRDSLLQVKPAAGQLLQQTMGRNLHAHARREHRHLRLLQCELARATRALAPPAAAEPRNSRRRTSVRATGVTVSAVPESCVHLRSELAEQPPRIVAPQRGGQ